MKKFVQFLELNMEPLLGNVIVINIKKVLKSLGRELSFLLTDYMINKSKMRIKNKLREIQPVYMGQEYFPVLVTNVGVSSPEDDISIELKKAEIAIESGTNIISDLSLVPNPSEYQKRYMDSLDVPFSNVAVYESFCNGLIDTKSPSVAQYINDFEAQARRGIDLITLHATVFKDDIQKINESRRLIPTTSRGGAMVLKNIADGGYENPYYVYFDDILDIAKEYDVCISLGPTFRPASVWDCHYHNKLHYLELERMGELVEKANAKGVGIAIEGIGHASIGDISNVINTAFRYCGNVPYRVLSVSTDTAMGFDHVSSAISSAVAIQYGASSITCVTRKEHIGRPDACDIKEAVYSAKIAAESGYRARKGEFPQDYEVTLARRENGCYAKSDSFLFNNRIPVVNKQKYKGKSCGMCGNFCPFLILDNIK